ncbi:MAG TPA: ribosomal-processing cysteine protease Prp [Clostridiales bacterium]|nr:ribosomal-processing cysteine protease Prp [Clostridiales bacterium]
MIAMIRVYFLSGPEGLIQEFTVKGHAGCEVAGKDIVCAAVSAVVQTAVIGLTDVAGVHPEHTQHNGFLKCVLPEKINEEQKKAASIILHTMLAGLMSIKSGYPNLISIQERMVD